MERVLNQLVERLKKAYQTRLKSVVLYGSAASGEHHGRFSDINVLCVLALITPRELEESTDIIRWWRELGNPAPLLLTEDEVRTATDCFSIEFSDMKERRRVLYGEDPIASLEIDTCFYRAQVEHDLRARLLRLRHKAAGVLGDKDLLRTLMGESVSTFCVLFRHALLLSGAEAPFGKREVIASAKERFGIDDSPFNALLDLREEKIKPRQLEAREILGNYMNQIQRVIDAVDRLEK